MTPIVPTHLHSVAGQARPPSYHGEELVPVSLGYHGSKCRSAALRVRPQAPPGLCVWCVILTVGVLNGVHRAVLNKAVLSIDQIRNQCVIN